ncbi:family 20 glycosylhydrolase [Flavobacterium sp. MAH-1]|uniref:beta-N-acetylhexosaminidase n=1 Tax=Flavobacterium agri TaxID=2743471 RepID=A0A7Y8Y521_9FLAO|nr:family 20 glycosylhydrolase [Flavobacterium agri]NUY82568.1 family 20 glycosylhydrolase [Flavobacterium agri]NYA72591.1 family 20 glycosylhydrolase [Flavobacterium agri]
MFKKILFALLISQSLFSQELPLIPQPQSLRLLGGEVKTIAFAPEDLFSDLDGLNAFFDKKSPSVYSLGNPGSIEIRKSANFKKEAYSLKILADKPIQIEASDASGAFYALQTLFQMTSAQNATTLPCLEIVDEPKFQWRGMHLDCSRHFWSVHFVKKYIDYLAMYKMNTFHWHLTDDQGWRIEIKKYPKLTEIGSKRKGTMAGHYNEQRWDDIPYGGFYTQEQIKDVVAYAKARHITIVPEIEMPGHAVAALSAYPELACTFGPFEVEKTWGVFDDVFCPKENTFKFLEDVLTEVMALFPSEYIHIGGDECPKTRWKTCAHCQGLIKEKGLKDEHELQSYFIQRIEKFVNSKGRRIIGWDEILEGGLAPNAAVMSWRGIDGGIAAAKQKHYVVMTPESNLYFDRYQGDPKNEPLGFGGFVPIEKVYNFNPIPEALSVEESKYILGAQANLWTEYIATEKHAEYMVFPRLAALAEVDWGTAQPGNFGQFQKRLVNHMKLLDKKGVNYSRSMFGLSAKVSPFGRNQIMLEFTSADKNPEIRYTTDGSEPTSESPLFPGKIVIPDSEIFKAARFEYGKKISETTTQEFKFGKSTARSVSLKNQPSPKYSGDGAFTLTNGIFGDKNRFGRDWLGFSGTDLEAVIDLSEKQKVESVTASFLQSAGSWIYFPAEVEIFVSKDNLDFKSVGKISASDIEKAGGTITIKFKKQKTQYVKVIAKNTTKIADGKPGAGNAAWLFADEILVN